MKYYIFWRGAIEDHAEPHGYLSKIEDEVGVPNHILISVNSPGSPAAKTPAVGDNYSLKAVLPLWFWDTTRMTEKYPEIFTVQHAKEILEFFNKYKDQVPVVIAHCDAGISRSAGVIAALSKITEGDDEYYWDRGPYVPNTLVYNTILREHYGHGTAFKEM